MTPDHNNIPAAENADWSLPSTKDSSVRTVAWSSFCCTSSSYRKITGLRGCSIFAFLFYFHYCYHSFSDFLIGGQREHQAPELPDSLSTLPPTTPQKAPLCFLTSGAVNGAFIPAPFLRVWQVSLSPMFLTSFTQLENRRARRNLWNGLIQLHSFPLFFFVTEMRKGPEELRDLPSIKSLVGHGADLIPWDTWPKLCRSFFSILSC